MKEKWHGTTGGYTNHRCRCDECRLAWNKYCQNRRMRRKGEYVYSQQDDHGTNRIYSKGCTCPDCKAFGSRYRKQLEGLEDSHWGTCEICKIETTVVWDHDHETGEFRGWVCRNCNHALGCFRDNVALMRRAVKYLM